MNIRQDVLPTLLHDLAAEGGSLEGILASLGTSDWNRATPSPGWTIRDQVSHLGFVDRRGHLALTDGTSFARAAHDDRADPLQFDRTQLAMGQTMGAKELLRWWARGRARLADVLGEMRSDARVPWYGPSMSAASFATARLMETWAHGCDVRDALELPLTRPPALWHIARLGFQTRAWSYATRNLPVPTSPISVTLTMDGERRHFGDVSADQHIRGSTLGFCLVVTQRRHVADVDLEMTGADAERWMRIAQAFAGAPGAGRSPSSAAR